jgi:hypothetical protein
LDIETLRYPPPTDTDLAKWTSDTFDSIEYHYSDLAHNFRVVEGFPDVEGVGTGRWAYDLPEVWEPPTEDYWMASVCSLGLKRPVEDPYYPMPALHAVVMRGASLVHDPNAAYADRVPYEPTVVAQSWWT